MTLGIDEKIRLSHLEAAIERGLKAFHEAGQALAEIRENRLYRDSHGDFETYCLDRWTISKTHANRLIEAAEVVSSMTPIGVILPANEAQARPLTALPVEQRVEAMQAAEAIAPTGKPTASHIARAADAVKSKAAATFQPGQTVTVLDESSPHYGQTVEVLSTKGVVVEATTADGQTIGLLTKELQPDQPKPERSTPQPQKQDHLEAALLELEITNNRVELLEAMLTRAVDLLQPQANRQPVAQWLEEANRLLE
ncbi:hypothetical protein IFO70_10320 [Phormidium tenue FACHB-886]|nr:hypothetical protein [Phormidium tenue FACHB-886]